MVKTLGKKKRISEKPKKPSHIRLGKGLLVRAPLELEITEREMPMISPATMNIGEAEAYTELAITLSSVFWQDEDKIGKIYQMMDKINFPKDSVSFGGWQTTGRRQTFICDSRALKHMEKIGGKRVVDAIKALKKYKEREKSLIVWTLKNFEKIRGKYKETQNPDELKKELEIFYTQLKFTYAQLAEQNEYWKAFYEEFYYEGEVEPWGNKGSIPREFRIAIDNIDANLTEHVEEKLDEIGKALTRENISNIILSRVSLDEIYGTFQQIAERSHLNPEGTPKIFLIAVVEKKVGYASNMVMYYVSDDKKERIPVTKFTQFESSVNGLLS